MTDIRDELLNMELHDQLDMAGFEVTRVAGGWIYVSLYDTAVCSTFVPYTRKIDTPAYEKEEREKEEREKAHFNNLLKKLF